MFWIIILALLIAAVAAGTVYMTAALGKFGALKKIESRPTRFLISLGVIAAFFALFTLLFDVFNAVIIYVHVILFFLLTGLVFRLIKRFSGREFKVNWRGWIALALSVIYLSAAFTLCVNVRRKDYELTTGKQIAPVRIAVISDAHIGAVFGGEGFAKHLETIKAQSPDVLLIPGDFVDDATARDDMIKACEALGKLDLKYGVWFAYGNHDKGYFDGSRDFTAEEFKQELVKNGVHVLEDSFDYAGDLCIVGRADASNRKRKALSELLECVDTSKYIVVLDHQPTDYENESQTDADLVVSGHTHGGQVIPVGLISDVFGLNDRVYGRETRNGTEFIVTSGIADWEFYFKTGTNSEYVIIGIEAQK